MRGGTSPRHALLQACFTVLAKFAQAAGEVHYLWLRALGRRRRVVDWRQA